MTNNFSSAPASEPERQLFFIEECRKLIEERSNAKGRKLTACIKTFGCQMNARDSEKIEGILDRIGYVVEEDEEKADIVIYNTCTVRENANLKVYGRLGHLKKTKQKDPDKIIALCGCMMQEPEVVEKIRTSYRFVDIIFGTHNIFKTAELLYLRLTSDSMIIDIWKDTNLIVEDLPSVRKYQFKSGINIMFGCNNFCSYCIVPYVRGRERSRKPSDIENEIKKLAADGVKEIMLLGQNVNSYGKNLDEEITFAGLLKRVEKIDGIERIRFMTSHPKDLSDELIDVIADSTKICHHIHLPVQTGSSRLLKDMNRHYTREYYLELVEKIRDRIPDVELTTDIIVGYPGETEEDFEDTLDMIRRVRYSGVYTFIYSKRTGTPAAKRADQIDEKVVKERFDRLLKLVNEVTHKEAEKYSGRVMKVLVEEVNSQDPKLVTGRLENNLTVHFNGCKEMIGSVVEVKLTECKGFYFIGEMV